MKKYIGVIVLCILFLVIGYFVGVFLPYKDMSCVVSDTPIPRGEYYNIFINLAVAIGTLLAVLVALFSNEIRSWFKKVSYVIQLNNDNIVEEIEDIKGTKKAKKYYNCISILNNGNINAQNCELYLEGANFTPKDTNAKESLNVGNTPICWDDYKNTTVYIPSQGKKVLLWFSIEKPQKQSTPDGKDYLSAAEINIIGLNNIESKAGKWELNYCLYSMTSKPKKFTLTIEWNGKWEEREKEMRNGLTIKLINV